MCVCVSVGNKGGVGITFFYGSVSMCFINCHLTSGNEKCSRFDPSLFLPQIAVALKIVCILAILPMCFEAN